MSKLSEKRNVFLVGEIVHVISGGYYQHTVIVKLGNDYYRDFKCKGYQYQQLLDDKFKKAKFCIVIPASLARKEFIETYHIL